MTAPFMQNFFLIALLFISRQATSQESSLKYCNKISTDSLRESVYILASDSMEGRETGRPGQKKAAYFLASKYLSWNLKPAGTYDASNENGGEKESDKREFNETQFFQNHPISLKNNIGKNLSVGGETFLYGKDFYYPDNFIDTTLILNNFIFIGLKKNEDFINNFKSKKYSNKNLILFDVNRDSLDYLINKPTLNVFSPNPPSLVLIVTNEKNIKKCFSEGIKLVPTPPNPQILITEKILIKFFPPGKYEKIIRRIKRNAKTTIKKLKCPVSVELVKKTNRLRGQNIIAFIPGSDLSNETVVISSHYDHLGKKDSLIYYGADDNASGTSAVLELARVFTEAKKDGQGPRRNILFLNVSGEEKGLLGSAWYITHPALPLDNTVADLNIDMIGRTDPAHDSIGIINYVYIIGSDKMSTELHTINEDQNKAGPALELNYKFDSPDDPNHFYRRSDHYNFVKNGIPVIFYFDGVHADYHKPTDTPDKINFELLTIRARLVFLTAWELANRNVRISIDKKNIPDK